MDYVPLSYSVLLTDKVYFNEFESIMNGIICKYLITIKLVE